MLIRNSSFVGSSTKVVHFNIFSKSTAQCSRKAAVTSATEINYDYVRTQYIRITLDQCEIIRISFYALPGTGCNACHEHDLLIHNKYLHLHKTKSE